MSFTMEYVVIIISTVSYMVIALETRWLDIKLILLQYMLKVKSKRIEEEYAMTISNKFVWITPTKRLTIVTIVPTFLKNYSK